MVRELDGLVVRLKREPIQYTMAHRTETPIESSLVDVEVDCADAKKCAKFILSIL